MRSKPSTLFTSKFSTCLSKLRDTSTIQIGHQQFKQLLMNTQLKDVIGPFVSKLDSIDRASQREKKEHAKLYIELIDHFGQEVLVQQYYQKLMESLVKKTVGVSDVIGYLCKGYISRIHPLENTRNYIIYILTLFKTHPEIHKIIKQLAQTISPIIVSSLQQQMITTMISQMNSSRQKAEYIQCIMALVLALQDKFTCQNTIQPFLVKNLKSDDWNVRKASVDICYTFIVVKEQINSVLHQLVKQLKYDKIKNVRDSVVNYQSLYKQVYGQEESFKPQIYSQKTIRSNTRNAKSPVLKRQSRILTQQQEVSEIKTPGKVRNQTFFKNAKNSDVIRVSQDLSPNTPSEFNVNHTRSQIQLQRFNVDDEEDNNELVKQNRSLHSGPLSHTKPVTKNNSKANLLNDQLNPVKRQKSPINTLSPKFSLNIGGIKPKQVEQKESQAENKRLIGDLNRFAKKQPKILPYDVDDQIGKNLNLSLQSEDNERRQYMPVKKSQMKNYGQKSDNLGKQQPRKIVTDQNTYFLPKSTSSGPSTPSLKQEITPKYFGIENASTEKPSSNTNVSMESPVDYSLSRADISQIKVMFERFQQKVMSRLDRLQSRVQSLEQSHLKLSFGKEAPLVGQKDHQFDNLQDSAISMKNDHYYPYEDTYLLKKPTNNNNNKPRTPQIQQNSWMLYTENQSPQQALQSNLLQKVNQALRNHNIDQAFSIALANNKVPLLLKLVQALHIPTDKTVQECLLMEIKKHVGRKEALKWLKNYLIERMAVIRAAQGGAVQKMLLKIRGELVKQDKSKEKDYDLLRNIVLNEMDEIFEKNYR